MTAVSGPPLSLRQREGQSPSNSVKKIVGMGASGVGHCKSKTTETASAPHKQRLLNYHIKTFHLTRASSDDKAAVGGGGAGAGRGRPILTSGASIGARST
ncbi:hypothetical protein EVAR_86358_1 [Eumeta japonica]|uniref:Uncharacterized protein n=1 Tax=Eumeta variegata TaxID=151549 RepID=A0A4C1YCU3_EUMVA|nr:hypothetical protein EVAR_86358_1 [Eumeta japonica]